MNELTPKQRVALQVASEVQNGMCLGLGSGATVNLVTAALGERIKRGELHDLRVVVASRWTDAAARAAGLPLATLNDVPQLDLAIDGADEVSPQYNMIKGGGGALLRERIVLGAAARRVIAVDEGKLVQTLGERWFVPVEVVQFGWRVADVALRELGSDPQLRMDGTQPFVTDEGNYILDCAFGQIPQPLELAQTLWAAPGVMDHGLFLGLADRVLVGTTIDVYEL
jgi:ribose 5-phosphate isomerase A